MTSTQSRSILITGFGPFPGMPINVSAQIAERLCNAARERWQQHHFEVRELPTEWIAGPETLQKLWDELRPDIALHFGVSSQAQGLQLETKAHNNCRMDPDAAGALPLSAIRIAGGGDVRVTPLAFDAIMRRLQVLRIPSCISDDAGAYLCNAILYDSIARASASRPEALTGFVHIPSQLALQRLDDAGQTTSLMSIDDVVVGGLAILECTLEQLEQVRKKLHHL